MTQLKKFCFIKELDTTLINKQDRNTSIIYRNYKSQIKPDVIKRIKFLCKRKKIKFYLSNNVRLAVQLGLDGAYIPSFNSSFKHLSYSLKPDFLLMGSAHTNKEIRLKEVQQVKIIFISSLFKKKNNYLGINKFRIIKELTNKEVIPLGGITFKNKKKIKLVNSTSFAGITYFR